jgi:metal-responsive CopG/Arc/MetJ family transcriptional regulator
MKTKTSVTLSEDLLKGVRRAARKGESRSQTIERLVRRALWAERQRVLGERDLKIINGHADELNAEALDALEYQVKL